MRKLSQTKPAFSLFVNQFVILLKLKIIIGYASIIAPVFFLSKLDHLAVFFCIQISCKHILFGCDTTLKIYIYIFRTETFILTTKDVLKRKLDAMKIWRQNLTLWSEYNKRDGIGLAASFS